MKKLVATLAVSAFVLTACGGADTSEDAATEEAAVETTDTTAVEESTENTEVTQLPTEDIGEGEFYIVNASGSSEDTDVVEFYDPDLMTPYMGIEGWDMDGSHKTFIYLNGELVAEEQMSDYQGSIDIPQDQYEVGTHTVTAVQYDDNTEDGEPIFVRNVEFEIQE